MATAAAERTGVVQDENTGYIYFVMSVTATH